MKFKGKEIKILYMHVKLKHKEADRIRQDQKETDRNSRNRQDPSIRDRVHRNENFVEIIPVFSTFFSSFKKKIYKSHFM